MIGARARIRTDGALAFVSQQFGGFGGVVGGGISIPILGGGGGAIRGGAFGGGGGGAPAGSIGPLLTLEAAFGLGFTAQSIADSIRVAEQEGRLGTPIVEGQGPSALTTIIDLARSALGAAIVLNLGSGLFEIFSPSGQNLGGGVTPEAAIEAVRGGPGGSARVSEFFTPATFAETTAPTGPAGGGDFNELLRTILGALGQLSGRQRAAGLEPVGIGGTVNVPVVRGSTADPTGTVRPTAAAFVPKPPPPPPPAPPPPTATQAALNIAQVLAQLLLQRRREQFIRDAQRRQREIIAAAEAARRARTMPFGQSGSDILDTLGRLGEIALPFFQRPADPIFAGGGGIIGQQQFGVPQIPVGFPAVAPLVGGALGGLLGEGLGGLFGGGGGSCPALFRPGATSSRARAVQVVCIPNPVSGESEFFGSLGKPLVFQRDVRMAKNIPKLIRKLGGHTSKAAHRRARKR